MKKQPLILKRELNTVIMFLHSKTLHSLKEPIENFNPTLQSSVEQLIDLLNKSSPMSDINYVFYKSGIKKLAGLKLPQGETSWMPIRNVIRIIANIASVDCNGNISTIDIRSMKSGCDYFEGEISLEIDGKRMVSGPYRWQWTAFPGYERSFDKFTIFPKITLPITN